MKVLSIVNTKGGTGKSTIAVNLATIAAMEGKSVLLIDTDGKQASSLAFSQIRASASKEEKLADISAVSIPVPTLFKDIKTYSSFDLIIIDAGAGDNALVRSAISCAAYGMLLIPVQPSIYDLWATEDTLKLLEELKCIIDINEIYLLLNRLPTNKRIKVLGEAKEAVDELALSYKINLLKSEISDRVAFKEAIGFGKNVVEYAAEKPAASIAAEEMLALWNEIKTILKLEE